MGTQWCFSGMETAGIWILVGVVGRCFGHVFGGDTDRGWTNVCCLLRWEACFMKCGWSYDLLGYFVGTMEELTDWLNLVILLHMEF